MKLFSADFRWNELIYTTNKLNKQDLSNENIKKLSHYDRSKLLKKNIRNF